MVDAYLEWRHSLALTQTSPPPSMQSQEADFGDNPSAQLLSAPGHAASLGASNQETMPPPPSLDYTVEVFDLRTLHTSVTIPRLSDMSSTAKALVLAGYLGTTPVMPTLAISLDTLELLRVIRMFKASYSVESFIKLLCYYYKVCGYLFSLSRASHELTRSPTGGGIIQCSPMRLRST